MILGVVLGEFVPSVRNALDTAKLRSVSVPIALGLVVMMWPPLTKVRYDKLPSAFGTSRLWKQLGISTALNWIVGPSVMLGLAWATLPDLPTYRTGVILVGVARCIAMVERYWLDIARGDTDYCAIVVVINALLQIALFSPYCVLFINVIGGREQANVQVSYGDVAISVLIYLGIPLLAGIITRYGVIALTSADFFQQKFLPFFDPLAVIGLLYTIIIIFSYQGHSIIRNLGPVFRVIVPQVLYFVIMWTSTFYLIHHLSLRESKSHSKQVYGYEMAVAQAFTAASNNFDDRLADLTVDCPPCSQQALAASIGPLTEVPVLLGLSWVALYLRQKLDWGTKRTSGSYNLPQITQ
ncbi:hypothetical protein GALMADRAFT_65734 [Galerina marginata CBS 339.88]|uniref:Arsenical-resistance protein n=1 Tax=Galerina marginata (strain CBS 339.88) TaxID=685588 RepID=A0A067T330_GALM3|nr:hypothetical protein GALMADRAFT_65734 [Galerina marginata CBS 339.88]